VETLNVSGEAMRKPASEINRPRGRGATPGGSENGAYRHFWRASPFDRGSMRQKDRHIRASTFLMANLLRNW
jgi:hypothetical protein